MAMKKAEMEAHDERYHAIITDARAAIEQKHFKHALDLAVSAWEHVDGMMQYERKYEDREFKSLDCVEIVLQYAPLLLDAQRLDQLQVLLDSRRRVQKNTAADLGQKIYKSRSLLWDAHHFWDFIEREGSVKEDDILNGVGGLRINWAPISHSWVRMAILRRKNDPDGIRVTFATALDQTVRAKCSSCGRIDIIPKRMCLEMRACDKCRNAVLFAIIAEDASDDR